MSARLCFVICALFVAACGGPDFVASTDFAITTAPDLSIGSSCIPVCDTRACGDDGCGGSCGTCGTGEHCATNGTCTQACVPSCGTHACGDDGCGGSCGTCATGACSTSGTCECTSDSDCGPDAACLTSKGVRGCYLACDQDASPTTCPAGQACTGLVQDDAGKTVSQCAGIGTATEAAACTIATDGSSACGAGLRCVTQSTGNECSQICDTTHACKAGQLCEALEIGGLTIPFSTCSPPEGVCVPSCTGKTCGSDGCGGSCGTCSAGTSCNGSGQCACTPVCTGKTCGPDGCGGTCGTCFSGTCGLTGVCSCTPSCNGATCGSDGCGGSCGTCSVGSTCNGTSCVVTPVDPNACDPVTNTGCASPNQCLLLSTENTACALAGTGTQGSFCSSTTLCEGGYACFANTCRKICDVSTGDGCQGTAQCAGVSGWVTYGACN